MEKAFEYKQIINKIKTNTSVTYPLPSGSITITPSYLENSVEFEILFRPRDSRLVLSIAQLCCGYEDFPYYIWDLPEEARNLEIGIYMIHKLIFSGDLTEEFEAYQGILEIILSQYKFHLSDDVTL